jgi:hypothetical protein
MVLYQIEAQPACIIVQGNDKPFTRPSKLGGETGWAESRMNRLRVQEGLSNLHSPIRETYRREQNG